MKDYDGRKITPKVYAESILIDAINCKMEFFYEDLDNRSQLTDKQKQEIYRQARKIAKRLAKVLRYEPESFMWS